jgi:hypothetical protein
MKKNTWFLAGMAALLLTFGLVFSACPTDSDDDDGGPRDTIVYTDVALVPQRDEAEDGAASGVTVAKITELNDGYEFSVTAGKLTLEFFRPLNTQAIDKEFNVNDQAQRWPFGRTDGEYKLTFVPADGGRVGVRAVGSLDRDEWGLDYRFNRRSEVSDDDETYRNASEIAHIYVTGDVTITRPAKTITVEDDDWRSGDYKAINLPLKAGWNLVQLDRNATFGADNTVVWTIKIADRDDIPWTYRKK